MCDHDFVIVTFGSVQFIAGEVVDDTRDDVVCRKCGQPQPEPAPVAYTDDITF